mgnify:CR=1 FL=1
MNQINLYMEKNITPKAIPIIVPMAYQAICMLNQKINEAQMITLAFSKEKNVHLVFQRRQNTLALEKKDCIRLLQRMKERILYWRLDPI